MTSSHEPVPILVAEDNEADLMLMRMAMDARRLHYELHHVSDGQEAIAFIRRLDADKAAKPPAILLLDINLPKTEGYEVLQEVRQSRSCRTLPVVIVTSSESPREIGRMFALGANRYFRKPSNFDEFMSLGGIVEEVLLEAGNKSQSATA